MCRLRLINLRFIFMGCDIDVGAPEKYTFIFIFIFFNFDKKLLAKQIPTHYILFNQTYIIAEIRIIYLFRFAFTVTGKMPQNNSCTEIDCCLIKYLFLKRIFRPNWVPTRQINNKIDDMIAGGMTHFLCTLYHFLQKKNIRVKILHV